MDIPVIKYEHSLKQKIDFVEMKYTIDDILQMPEGQTFECKSIRVDPKALAVTIVAMGNADGGLIAVGISDKTRQI